MLDALLAVAALAALAGAVARDRTALVLLVSFAVSKGMCELEVPFEPWLWTAIDLAVGGAIIWQGTGARDRIIVAMLAPAIVLYHTQPDWWAGVVNLIVAVQMLVTFPVRPAAKALRSIAHFLRDYDPWRDLDLRAWA